MRIQVVAYCSSEEQLADLMAFLAGNDFDYEHPEEIVDQEMFDDIREGELK